MDSAIKKYTPSYWKEICRIHDEARKEELKYASLEDAFLPLEVVAKKEGLFEYRHIDAALQDNKVVGFCAYSEEEVAWLYVLPEKKKSFPVRCRAMSSLQKILDQYDIIFSNACLQWIPDHPKFIPMLFDKLNKNGILAVQMPMNGQETLFQIMDEVIAKPQWNFSAMQIETIKTLLPEEYFDILASCTNDFDIWETVYYHKMPSTDAMVDWIKGTSLRPYLNALDQADAERLEREIRKRAADAYHTQGNGEYIFKFRRFFFVAGRTNHSRDL